MAILNQFLYLSRDADAADFDAAVNGSVTPVEFILKPSAHGLDYLEIYRMIVMIEDAGAVAADNYGGVAGPLTNGVRVQHRSNGTTTDLDGGLAIKSNGHWARVAYDMTEHTFGAGNNFISVRWSFHKSGSPLRLGLNDELVVTISDDLSGLVDHHFMAQGLKHYTAAGVIVGTP